MSTLPQPKSVEKTSTVRFYARRSTNDALQAQSLDMQRDKSAQVSAARGLPWAGRVEYVEADNTCRDEFESHHEWHRLIREVLPGDVVIVYERSRIGADLEYALALRDLTTRGARLIVASTNEEPRWQGGFADAAEIFQGIANKEELTKLRKRTRDGLRQLVSAGYWSGPVPYGFRAVDVGNGKKRLEVDAEQAQVVLMIVAWYLAGHGTGYISRRLNAEGVLCPQRFPNGKKDKSGIKVPVRAAWAPDRIADMLRSPTLRGVVLFGRTRTVMANGKHARTEKADPSEIIHGTCPAIIDAETAARIDALLAARTKPAVPRNVRHPLSGWARCASCRGSISTYGADRGTVRYVCDRARRVGDCTCRVRVSVDRVEEAIVDGIMQQVISDDVLDTVRAGIRGAAEAARFATRVDPAEIAGELEKLKARKARALRLAVDTGDEDADAEVRALGHDIKSVEKRLAEARRPVVDDLTVKKAIESAEREIADLRATVRVRETLRGDLQRLFPGGLFFHPLPDNPNGWEITGDAAPCTLSGVGTPWAVPMGRGGTPRGIGRSAGSKGQPR